jgi:hypothetical protein
MLQASQGRRVGIVQGGEHLTAGAARVFDEPSSHSGHAGASQSAKRAEAIVVGTGQQVDHAGGLGVGRP